MRPFRIFQKKESPVKSEEEKHYQYIISFFKFVLQISLVLLTIFIGAGSYLFYKDRGQFNDDIRAYLKESRDQIKEMTNDAKTTVKETKDESNQLSNNLKSDAEKNIQYIREDARTLALAEATKQVNEAFKEKNIQISIQEAAEREITSSVRDMVFDKLRLLPNVMLALDRIRAGDKISFLYLDSLATNCKEPFIKSISDSIVSSKREEYDIDGSDEFHCLQDIRISDLLASGIETVLAFNIYNDELKKNKPDSSENYCRKLFNETKEDLNMNNNLNHIAYDFKVFRFLTGEKIKMFDFQRAKSLKYIEGIKHPYKCTGEFGARRL
jgi:F0F1-type ATP synthase membrane subunit b/b'